MGFRVTWDVANIFEYMIGLHQDLGSLRDQVFRGAASRPRMTRSTWAELDRLLNANREAHLERVTAALRSHSVEIQSNPPRIEREVMNLACLVERRTTHAFEQGVLLVAQRFDNNFAFDINGPWPPHNFVDITLQLS